MISDEQRRDIENGIRRDVPREVFVDIQQHFPLAAAQAKAAVEGATTAVAGGIPLSERRIRKSVGIVRHNVTDEFFEQSLVRNGATFVHQVEIDQGPEGQQKAPIYVTTGKFGGTLVGFASHRDAEDLPIKNFSRLALCNQNRGLTPDLFGTTETFSERDRFVVVMVQRDPAQIEKIASLKVCVLDAGLQYYVVKADLAEFLAGYGAVTTEKTNIIHFKEVSSTFKSRDEDGADKGESPPA